MKGTIPKKWRSLLLLIPQYDSIATAGPDDWFDAKAAQLALDFFPELIKHVEGDKAGEPFELEPWQQAIIANIFGWKTTDIYGRSVRRYREAMIYLPRGNGKTTLVAGLALFVLFCDKEIGQQNYIAAGDREQAGFLFRHCRGMVEQEKELSGRCRIYGGHAEAGQSRSIVREETNSFLRVISADGDSKHGGNVHLAIIDELHTQPNRELVEALITSTGKKVRKEPLIVYMSTADYDRPSVCNEKHEYACRIRSGETKNPAFLPVIYEAPRDADWTSEATWSLANPNLGVSVSLDYLRRECLKAQDSPSYENTFRRLHLDQKTETDIRWITMSVWDSCGLPFDPEILLGRECFAGLDFGWRDDYAALELVFPGDLIHVLSFFWLPREGRRDKYAFPTSDFIAQGLVKLTEGNATDIDAIYQTLRECRDKYDLVQVALDPSNARKQGQDLMNDGFDVVEFIQSKRNYNEPCRYLESSLKECKIRHNGNPVLRWMASNVTIDINGLGEIMPKKVKSSEKIDGICGMLMGLGAMMHRPEPTSVYESRGLTVFGEAEG